MTERQTLLDFENLYENEADSFESEIEAEKTEIETASEIEAEKLLAKLFSFPTKNEDFFYHLGCFVSLIENVAEEKLKEFKKKLQSLYLSNEKISDKALLDVNNNVLEQPKETNFASVAISESKKDSDSSSKTLSLETNSKKKIKIVIKNKNTKLFNSKEKSEIETSEKNSSVTEEIENFYREKKITFRELLDEKKAKTCAIKLSKPVCSVERVKVATIKNKDNNDDVYVISFLVRNEKGKLSHVTPQRFKESELKEILKAFYREIKRPFYLKV